MGSKEQVNLPWVEKYRPKSLDELVSHEEIVRTIDRFLSEGRLPHLLFYGPPGTGKTSLVLACARKLYSPKQMATMVLELNASDDRGIGIVRGPIMNFASTRAVFRSNFKLVVLDEADAMTKDAQNALRRIMEKFTENVRFCLICNYLGNIIPAIQSRCTRFRFGPLQPPQILPRLREVASAESVELTPDGEDALVTLSGGDMRRVLNVLQAASMACGKVDANAVYTCVAHPTPDDIASVIKSLLNDNFVTAYKKIRQLQAAKGLALQDILTEVHSYIHRIELPKKAMMDLLLQLSEAELRLTSGACERLQLSSVVSAFFQARQQAIKEDGHSSTD